LDWIHQSDREGRAWWVRGDDKNAVEKFINLDTDQVARLGFDDKELWFRQQCFRRKVSFEKKHKDMWFTRGPLDHCAPKNREDRILEETRVYFKEGKQQGFLIPYRMAFVGETVLEDDAGGIYRGWVEQCAARLFHKETGLFEQNASGKYHLSIKNRALWNSYCRVESVMWAEFAGKFLGKVMFDGHLCPAHLSPATYASLLGQALDMDMLAQEAPAEYAGLTQMRAHPEQAEDLYMFFETDDEADPDPGATRALKEGGKDIQVTEENLEEFVVLKMNWLLRDRYHTSQGDQMLAFCNGFWEVLGRDHKIFTVQELENVMCGMDQVDLDDWKAHTSYTGDYSANHRVIQWFWEIIKSLSGEERLRVVCWGTGSSCIPMGGFSMMEQEPGEKKAFTINSIRFKLKPYEARFPKGHTCTNTIDLPQYPDKETLREYMSSIIDPGPDGGYFKE